jgi:hypothetical protein
MNKILPIVLTLTVFLAACAPKAAATMAPADVQGTAVSAAWTMVASTQAAIPSATPLPSTPVPSPTSLPTFTPEPLLVPTLQPLILPTATIVAAASDPNNCLKSLDVNAAGPLKNVSIENQTPSQVNLSLNLYKINPYGQCGSMSFTLGKGTTRQIQIPTGYWFAYSWILNPPSTGSHSFYISPSKSTGSLRLIIKKDVIGWTGP